MIGDGGQRFQPAWHEDIAEAIAIAAERSDLAGRTLELAGTELTSQRELLEMLQELTNRSPAVAPVPHLLASLGMKAAELVGLDVGFNESQLQMLIEGNVIAGDATNALTEVLGIVPTPLRRGLAMLADVQPEQLPAEGIGRLERKRYWVEIRGARVDADELFTRLRTRFGRFMASLVETDAEPEAAAHIEPGATLTLSLPLRGHVQVRVAEVNAAKREFTLVTVDGHPLAGAARFRLEERGGSLRFEVCVYERPATLADLVAMRALGDALQSSTWITVVENVVRESGGNAGEVRRSSDELGQRETREVEEWAEELVLTRKRDEASV
jgi:NADH dehydrogenase